MISKGKQIAHAQLSVFSQNPPKIGINYFFTFHIVLDLCICIFFKQKRKKKFGAKKKFHSTIQCSNLLDRVTSYTHGHVILVPCKKLSVQCKRVQQCTLDKPLLFKVPKQYGHVFWLCCIDCEEPGPSCENSFYVSSENT